MVVKRKKYFFLFFILLTQGLFAAQKEEKVPYDKGKEKEEKSSSRDRKRKFKEMEQGVLELPKQKDEEETDNENNSMPKEKSDERPIKKSKVVPESDVQLLEELTAQALKKSLEEHEKKNKDLFKAYYKEALKRMDKLKELTPEKRYSIIVSRCEKIKRSENIHPERDEYLGIVAKFIETNKFQPIGISRFWILLAYTIIIGNVISLTLYGHLLKKYSATLISLAGFSIPLFVQLFSYTFLNEPISYKFLISLLLTFTGFLIFSFNKKLINLN